MLLNNLHHLFISGRCRSRAASNLAAAIVRATSHLGGRIAANLAARITADLRRCQLVKLDGAVGILEAAAWSYTSGGVYGVIPDGILLVVGVHHHCTVAVVDTLVLFDALVQRPQVDPASKPDGQDGNDQDTGR